VIIQRFFNLSIHQIYAMEYEPPLRRSTRPKQLSEQAQRNAVSDSKRMLDSIVEKFNALIKKPRDSPVTISAIGDLVQQAKCELQTIMTYANQQDGNIAFYIEQTNIMSKHLYDIQNPEQPISPAPDVNEHGTLYSANSRPVAAARSGFLVPSSAASSVRSAQARFEAAKTQIELDSVKKQAEILARREELELRVEELEARQRILNARAEIIQEFELDQRAEVEATLEDKASVPSQYAFTPIPAPRSLSPTEYIPPTPRANPQTNARPQPRPRSVNSQIAPNLNPIQVTPMKLVPVHQPTQNNDGVNTLAESLSKALNTQRASMPEPPIFRGNPLAYPAWKCAFTAYMSQLAIPDEYKIHYLLKYVGSPVVDSINSFSLIETPNAYYNALQTLQERFGSSFTISTAFRSKLDSFQRIKPHDAPALRSFSDFLNQCESAMSSVDELSILNDPHTHINLSQTLPDYLANKWKEKTVKHRQHYGRYPMFHDFAKLVKHHSDIQNDPLVLGMTRAASSNNPIQNQSRRPDNSRIQSSHKHTFLTSKQNNFHCLYCDTDGHSLSRCRYAFAQIEDSAQQTFIMENKLCWKCLRPGHHSRECESPCKCAIKDCGKNHPTSRHDQVINSYKPYQDTRPYTNSYDNSDQRFSVTESDAPTEPSSPLPECNPAEKLLDNSATTLSTASNSLETI